MAEVMSEQVEVRARYDHEVMDMPGNGEDRGRMGRGCDILTCHRCHDFSFFTQKSTNFLDARFMSQIGCLPICTSFGLNEEEADKQSQNCRHETHATSEPRSRDEQQNKK